MIFWIVLALVLGGWIWCYIISGCRHDNYISMVAILTVVLSLSLVAMCMTVAVVGSRITKDIDTQVLIQKEKSLRWQSEINSYKYDDIARQNLADRVTEWNANLAANRARKQNIWVSIFFPIDYDQFDYIPIELLEGHEE